MRAGRYQVKVGKGRLGIGGFSNWLQELVSSNAFLHVLHERT